MSASLPAGSATATAPLHLDEAPALKVLVYSDDRTTREQVLLSLGRRLSPDLPVLEITEFATEPAVIAAVDSTRFDLLIFDGEATPVGGMGLARQMKDEIYRCPPILVLIGRPQDAWLATWSRADGVVSMPIAARTLADTASVLLRRRLAIQSQ